MFKTAFPCRVATKRTSVWVSYRGSPMLFSPSSPSPWWTRAEAGEDLRGFTSETLICSAFRIFLHRRCSSCIIEQPSFFFARARLCSCQRVWRMTPAALTGTANQWFTKQRRRRRGKCLQGTGEFEFFWLHYKVSTKHCLRFVYYLKNPTHFFLNQKQH